MTFTSYSQNFEDVMLWRALKHVEHGCYVDVGAQHPVIDSVSKAFYEHGWRGIHIEPVPQYAELLRVDRPDETVLQLALSDHEGSVELNVIPGTGLSTAVQAHAQRHQQDRQCQSQQISVKTKTLKSALESLAGKPVHWLKIDVEGFEAQVLKGWDSQVLRPWILVVEATIPGSAETDYADWDGIVTAADYQFVYFDGLNRFYVAQEHAELALAFLSPPNVFDDIRLTENSSICIDLLAAFNKRELELGVQAGEIARAEAQTAQARAYTAQVEAHAIHIQAELEAQLRSIRNSRLWRATNPLRLAASWGRRIYTAIREGRLLSGLTRQISSSHYKSSMATKNPHSLSPRVARIYSDLNKAIDLEHQQIEIRGK